MQIDGTIFYNKHTRIRMVQVYSDCNSDFLFTLDLFPSTQCTVDFVPLWAVDREVQQ